MKRGKMKIRLFIKPYCGWCHKAIRWLDEHDIEYEKIDVIADDKAFEEMDKMQMGRARMAQVKYDPAFDPLRDDPRFAEFTKKHGIP